MNKTQEDDLNCSPRMHNQLNILKEISRMDSKADKTGAKSINWNYWNNKKRSITEKYASTPCEGSKHRIHQRQEMMATERIATRGGP